jgi:hypothetical protein
MNLPPSPSPKLDKMPVRLAALAFDLFVLYFPSPCTEVEFLEEIQTEVLRVFLLAIHRHLY